jgi:hypothetical protein
MTEDNRCLEVHVNSEDGAYGGHVVLDLYKERGLIDYHPFFESFFAKRDQFFGEERLFPRYDEHEKFMRYEFDMVEFGEAFFGRFQPKTVASFLEDIVMETGDEEKFIQMIRTFESRYSMVLSVMHEWMGRPSNEIARVSFYPVNITREKLIDVIRMNVPRHLRPRKWGKIKSGWYNGIREDVDGDDLTNFVGPIYKDQLWSGEPDTRSVNRLRKMMLEKDPRVIIFPFQWGLIKSLDPFTMIKEYNLPTGHLDIVRKKRKKEKN